MVMPSARPSSSVVAAASAADFRTIAGSVETAATATAESRPPRRFSVDDSPSSASKGERMRMSTSPRSCPSRIMRLTLAGEMPISAAMSAWERCSW